MTEPVDKKGYLGFGTPWPDLKSLFQEAPPVTMECPRCGHDATGPKCGNCHASIQSYGQ